MLSLLAVTDPQTTLSSGNAIAILSLIVVTLAGVIVYQARKMDKQATDHATEVRDLNKLIYTEVKTHAADYAEMAKNDQMVLQGNSQSNELLAAKIEAVRGKP